MTEQSRAYTVGDAPIGHSDDDRLDRDRLAKALAHQVLSPRREDGFVLGIDGAWGSGKTSLLALLRNHLRKDDLPIDFNPWLYSDKNELVMRFLAQVRAQLPDDGKYQKAKRALGRFQGALTPLSALAAIHPAFTLLSAAASVADKAKTAAEASGSKTPDTSAEEDRDAVKDALLGLPGRLVVFIDDVDRLASNEVAEMMRVIKLVGDFPNVSYVVAFDRGHVERALEEVHGGSGSAFLEKVIQSTHAVPYVPEHELAEMLRTDLKATLADAEYPSPFDSPRWPVIEANIVAPLLTTVRDVRRLANVLPVALTMTEANVDAADVAALEAVRLAEPGLHKELVNAAPALTRAISEEFRRLTPQEVQDQDRDVVDDFVLAASKENRPLAHNVVLHLFPGAAYYLEGEPVVALATDRWHAERRVASLPALLTYLSKAVGRESVGAGLTDEATQLLGRPDEFDAFTSQFSVSQLGDLLKRIRMSLNDLDLGQVPEMLASLSNVQGRLPYDGRGGMDPFLGGRLLPIVHDLRARLGGVFAQDRAVGAYEATTTLSSAFRFIQFAGKAPKGVTMPPVFPDAVLADLEAQHLRDLLAADAPTIDQEQAFFELIRVLIDDHDDGRRRLGVLMEDDSFLRHILAGYVSALRWNDGSGTQARLDETDDLHILADIVGRDVFDRVAREASARRDPLYWGPLDQERLHRALRLSERETAHLNRTDGPAGSARDGGPAGRD